MVTVTIQSGFGLDVSFRLQLSLDCIYKIIHIPVATACTYTRQPHETHSRRDVSKETLNMSLHEGFQLPVVSTHHHQHKPYTTISRGGKERNVALISYLLDTHIRTLILFINITAPQQGQFLDTFLLQLYSQHYSPVKLEVTFGLQ